MPSSDTQISAFVSAATKDQMERYTRATGVKQNHLVEEAIQHHLLALRELPADIIVHPRLVLSKKSGRAVMKRLKHPAKPTAKLRTLMARGDD
jgi:uncharacterized protein (DUF1778 family)